MIQTLVFFWSISGTCLPSVPFTVETAPLGEVIALSGAVEPKVTATVKIRWYSLLKNIRIQPSQILKVNDPIAEVSLEYFDFRKTYLGARVRFLRNALSNARIEEIEVARERKKTAVLVAKGIIAASQLEKGEVKEVDAALKRIRVEKEVHDMEKQIAETELQIRQANYYSPIAGVVTEMLVNPRQVSGAVIAMPDARLARIDQPGSYVAASTALDTQAIQLHSGMEADVLFESTGERIRGMVTQIKQNTTTKSGLQLFDVSVEFSKDGPIIPRGYSVRIDVPIAKDRKVVSIPWNAVRSTSGTSVLKYDKGAGWTEQPVELGRRGRHRVEVVNGLNPGEIVEAVLW